MQVLLIIVIIIVALVALLLIVAALASKEYRIEESIIINQPKQKVFDYIKHIKNQDNYNKWVMMDPGAKKEYIGTDGTVGFIYTWNSTNKNVGQGEQEIKQVTEGDKLVMEIRFIRPFANKSDFVITTQTVSDNQTKVTWIFSGLRKYGLRILHILFNIKKLLTKDIQASLSNLKTVLEK